jgi:hypothetical protein
LYDTFVAQGWPNSGNFIQVTLMLSTYSKSCSEFPETVPEGECYCLPTSRGSHSLEKVVATASVCSVPLVSSPFLEPVPSSFLSGKGHHILDVLPLSPTCPCSPVEWLPLAAQQHKLPGLLDELRLGLGLGFLSSPKPTGDERLPLRSSNLVL